jgi:multidrug resistance efflux pump
MKKATALHLVSLVLGLSLSGISPAEETNDLANNAYVKLYEQWLALDHNHVERLSVVRDNLLLDLERGKRLAEKKVITEDELLDLEMKYRLAELTLKRQQLKITEAEARLSIVKSKVAAGMTDIPICIRPMDSVTE